MEGDNPMTIILEQRYFSLKDIARYTGLSEKTLYKWAEAGNVPAHKVGRVWRFDRDEMDRFMQTQSPCVV